MIVIKLNRGKYKLEPEKALRILKKKMIKERVLQEVRERSFFVSKGRKEYLARNKRLHQMQIENELKKQNKGE